MGGESVSLFRKREKPIAYDSDTQQPAVRRSICTGEMTVGFIDIATGKFREYMLARDQRELEDFCRSVGISPEEITTIY